MGTQFLMQRFAAAFRTLLFLSAVVFLSGCAQTLVMKQENHQRPSDTVSVVLMPVDIELSSLTTGGIEEVRADWTATAEQLVSKALKEKLAEHSATLVPYKKPGDALSQETHNQLIKLHNSVGATILLYSAVPAIVPPTKRNGFEWSLGKEATALKDAHNADYGLFVFLRDSYATAGRKALIVTAAVLGVGVEGGSQVGFATLVDLRDGNVIWFNRLFSSTGDLRTEQPAQAAVEDLIEDIPL